MRSLVSGTPRLAFRSAQSIPGPRVTRRRQPRPATVTDNIVAAIACTIPILLYHSISSSPAPWIAPFTVTPERFSEHLDAIAAAGATTMTVSALGDALDRDARPERPVLLTFDDGFADTLTAALPRWQAHGMVATVYVTTGFMRTGSGPQDDVMLDGAGVRELADAGAEIGGHSDTHPELDTLAARDARDEIVRCRAALEDALGAPVRSFAYPHGYSSARVRRIVDEQGFDSACGVGNALSHEADDGLRRARLMVGAGTTAAEVAAWVAGTGAPLAGARERVRTRAWRAYRRLAVRAGVRAPVQLG